MDAPPLTRSLAHLSVGLALGGGAARGVAHIAMLEAFDELGIRPKIIAGCSIGAVIGACYAAGLSAKEIRNHIAAISASPRAAVRHLLRRLPGRLTRLWSPRHPSVVNGVAALEMLLPDGVNTDFGRLQIPLRLTAVDYRTMEPVVLSEGPLIPAVAASASLPSLMRPIEIGGRLLFDGGFANPTPFDIIIDDADVIVAVDVKGRPDTRKPAGAISKAELENGAFFALFTAVTREKLARRAPDILLRPDVGLYRTMDFAKMDEILARSASEKARLRHFLSERCLGAHSAQGTSSTM